MNTADTLRTAMRAALARLDAGGPANVEEARRLLREGLAVPGEAMGEDFQRGAEAMRSAAANWLMCGCDAEQRRLVTAASVTDGPNSAARWRACGRTDCLCLLAAEMLDVPMPQPPETRARPSDTPEAPGAVQQREIGQCGPVARWAERWERPAEPSGLSERGA